MIATLVCLLAGCVLAGGGISFQTAYQAALPKAQAWSADARLYYIDAGQVNSDGRTSAILGQWVFDFRAASKPGKSLLVTDLGGRLTQIESTFSASTDPQVLAREQADIDALAAWGESSDSPQWFTDGQWPSGATLVVVDRFCNREWAGNGSPCPFEDDAIVAQNSSSTTAVELYPTRRQVTVPLRGGSDGGTGGDMIPAGSCDPARGEQDCGGKPNCDPDTRRCGSDFTCSNDRGCSGLGTICDPITGTCWHSCFSNAQCASGGTCNLSTYRCQ